MQRYTKCRICGKAREENSPHALCKIHRLKAGAAQSRKWREAHPDEAAACTAKYNELARKKRFAGRPSKLEPPPRKRSLFENAGWKRLFE